MSERIAAFDRAKGIAIVLIVALHVGPGLVTAGLVPDSTAMRFAEGWAYSFHVQVFFLIAGWLAWPALQRWRFHRDRVLALYYPYLVWSALSVLLVIALPGANHALGWRDLLLLPVMPQMHFWFVPALLVTTMAAALVARSDALLVLLGLAGIAYSPAGMWNWMQTGTYLPWLCLGMFLARHRWLPPTPWPLVLLATALSLGGAWVATAHGFMFKDPLFFPIGLCGCYAVFGLAQLWPSRLLDELGRRSFAIYLAHGLFATAARVGWMRVVGVHAPWAALAVCTLAGIAGPVALDAGADRLGLARVIGLRPLRFGHSRR